MISERYPSVGSLPIKCDVGKEDDIKNVVDKAVEKFGRLDVMVRPGVELEAGERGAHPTERAQLTSLSFLPSGDGSST